MNRTDRLFALLLELRRDGWVQADELAHTFGVSVRTIYRDLLALSESGVPVVSAPGKGYRLMDGHFLPPLHLSAQEAVMLALGADVVRQAFDAEYAEAAASALKKLRSALPEERQDEVERLRRQVRMLPSLEPTEEAVLRTLRAAVLGQRVVSFVYHRPQSAPRTRRVYPLALVHLSGAWMLGAFDPVRGGRRTFRLSRMEEVQVLTDTFEPDPTWSAEPAAKRERHGLTVRLRFPSELRRTVQERPSFFRTNEQETPLGLEVTLQVGALQDILAWVLSWGAGVQVLEPAELREAVRAEARRMLLT
ncbi:putative DNA-binding transcriptional regulator YafY [Deinobacterium chartae]|uniref:Putative DNA-binding transcriptional regulator YafY n=1 Tax=Deinobacterium chartae TaxID=521158 RepID=A0A841I8L5_9DEIO|nr:YafY family protein [Deinobacterium chartae]MBB6100125.1 putative DNA-binding transcriptional regulator YafY [Deinobacterium chartae]